MTLKSYKKGTDRYELNHWLSTSRQAAKQIEQLTTDSATGKKYAVLFKERLEYDICQRYPLVTSYKRYAIYQKVRNELHSYFGYDTKQMTRSEYEAALEFIERIDY